MFMDIRLLLNSYPNQDVPIEWLWLKADAFVLHMPWIWHLCRNSPATSLQPDVGGEHYPLPGLVSFWSGKSCPMSARCPDSVRIFEKAVSYSAVQGRERTVRTFGILVRRCLGPTTNCSILRIWSNPKRFMVQWSSQTNWVAFAFQIAKSKLLWEYHWKHNFTLWAVAFGWSEIRIEPWFRSGMNEDEHV